METTMAPNGAAAPAEQARRDQALHDVLSFVREYVEGTSRGVTLHIHRLPVEMFEEDGPFDSVALRNSSGRRYLVGTKSFGDELDGIAITCFSETVA